MDPKEWRISQSLTQRGLAKRMISEGKCSYTEDGLTTLICRVERGQRNATGRLTAYYYRLSGGEVTPEDFPNKH